MRHIPPTPCRVCFIAGLVSLINDLSASGKWFFSQNKNVLLRKKKERRKLTLAKIRNTHTHKKG